MAPLLPPLPPQRLHRIGLISDVQYADIEDGFSYAGVPRYYRHSLKALGKAMQSWNENQVQVGINLGDIIDGKSLDVDSNAALNDVLSQFSKFEGKVYHVIGNHCLYNFDRNSLHQRLSIEGARKDQSYYSVELGDVWRLIVVDGYDISTIGWAEDHPHTKQANEILDKYNPNENKCDVEGLQGKDRRFVAFGGGIGPEQLQWLQQQLQLAKRLQQKVIVLGHIPFVHYPHIPTCSLWNYEEVLEVLQETDVVVATFAGHVHNNALQIDSKGIHHIALASVLETKPGNDCHGWLDIYNDRIEFIGVGEMQSLIIPSVSQDIPIPALV
eukprot:TRINITY_DN12782_c0_g1_i1.p1 TRINITY_DN12782_c0_g1~~TRINITY_DN12782_c0_g1_i1.p1  ORF type:complete len:327 (+),score=35.68 TRINITY_DN12782_c0_g1_i1:52-1032(+)